MKYTYKFDGGELDCELEYEQSESGSRELGTGLQIEPDTPENAILITAKIGEIDISELLSDDLIGFIEEKAILQ